MISTPWTTSEDEILTQMKSSGATDKEVAEELGKTEQAVRGRRRRLHGVTEFTKQDKSMVVVNRPRVLMRGAVVDIETTSFKAGGISSHLVCVCILPLDGEEVETYSIKFTDRRNDKRLLKEVMQALSDYDLIIGHNILAFDLGWLNTRLSYYQIPYPSHKWLVYDTYSAARRIAIKAERKSLAFLCDFFRVPFIKTSIYPVSWSKIDSPIQDEFEEALDDITFHCAEDVKANRLLFDALWPMDRSMTNLPVLKKL